MKGLGLIVAIMMIWAAGLMEFADRIARLTPPRSRRRRTASSP